MLQRASPAFALGSTQTLDRMRRIISASIGVLCGIAALAFAGDRASTYVAATYPVLLGSQVQFLETLVVTSMRSDRLDELPGELKKLCATVPGFDRHRILVVTDSALVSDQAFLDFQRNYVVIPQKHWKKYSLTFVAAVGPQGIELFPVDPDRARRLPLQKDWCSL